MKLSLHNLLQDFRNIQLHTTIWLIIVVTRFGKKFFILLLFEINQ